MKLVATIIALVLCVGINAQTRVIQSGRFIHVKYDKEVSQTDLTFSDNAEGGKVIYGLYRSGKVFSVKFPVESSSITLTLEYMSNGEKYIEHHHVIKKGDLISRKDGYKTE